MNKKRSGKPNGRKTSKIPTKVLSIGVLTKITKEERTRLAPQLKTINDELFAAFLYQNKLIQIENTRRARFRRLRRSVSISLNDLESQVDALEGRIQELRKGLKRKRDRETPEQAERIAQIETLKKEKKALYPQIKRECDAINEKHFVRASELRTKQKEQRLAAAAKAIGKAELGPNDKRRHQAMQKLHEDLMASPDLDHAGKVNIRIERCAHASALRARKRASAGDKNLNIAKCSIGTYLAIESAVQQAKESSKGPLKIRRWDDSGRIGIQLTKDKGLTVPEALSGRDPLLKIEIREGVPLRKSKSDIFYPSHSRPIDLHAKERRARAELYARHPELRPYRKAVTARMKLSGRVNNAVFLDFNGVLHRPLPEDGLIKWAYLKVQRIGYDYRYELQLSVESKAFVVSREGIGAGKRIAVDFGWRVLPDRTIRVATTWDGKNSDYVTFDDFRDRDSKQVTARTMFDKHRQIERLIGYSDDHFNEAVKEFRKWLENLSDKDVELFTPILNEAMPKHVRSRSNTIQLMSSHIAKWRAHRKLLRVVNVMQSHDLFMARGSIRELWGEWRRDRIPDKRAQEGGQPVEDLFVDLPALVGWLRTKGVRSVNAQMSFYLEAWRQKEQHIINMARHMETKLKRQRQDFYRAKACTWGKEVAQIAIEKWNKSETAQTPKYEEDWRCAQEENSNSIRQFVGVYRFTDALRQKFGGDLVEIEAKDITTEHFGCGGAALAEVNPLKPGLNASPMLRCSKCHASYDQDVNRAKHLWHRAFGDDEQSRATQDAPGSRNRSRRGKYKDSLDTAAE